MQTVPNTDPGFDPPSIRESFNNQQHPRSETIEKARHCPYCSRVFHKNDHYDRHLRSHTNEKPYGCKICGKYYPRRDTLFRHFKIHKVECGKRGHSSTVNKSSTHESHQDAPSAVIGQELNETSMGFPPAQTLGSGFDSEDATFDLTIGGGHEQSIVATSSLHVAQPEKITRSSSPITNSEQESLSGIFNRGSTLQPTATTSVDSRTNPDIFPHHQITNMYGSAIDNALFADHQLHFDATSLVLDEGVFDIGGREFASNEPRNLNDWAYLRSQSLAVGKESNKPPTVLDLWQMWYIQIWSTVDDLYDDYNGETGGQVVDTPRKDLDETYRTTMVEELCIPLRNEPLPPIDFLNLCLHLFFTRINVTLPIIHNPTFRPSGNNVLLVLTMCSAGAMTMTSSMATRVGSVLFERVIKAGRGDSWETGLSEPPYLTRDRIQRAIIGQTIALLSGDPTHRSVSDAYHGCLISLGRHVKLFTKKIPELDLTDMASAEKLERVWKQWARYEEMKRAALVLHIHDAEIAALFHHAPAFRQDARRPPDLAPAELFQAPTAALWAIKYSAYKRSLQGQGSRETDDARLDPQVGVQIQKPRAGIAFEEHIRDQCTLNSWSALSGIGAAICECRDLSVLSLQRITGFEADLVMWYNSTKNCCRTKGCRDLKQPELPFCLRPLWHYTFMTLAADLDLLELAVGREGSNIAASTLDQVRSWITSPESKRCLLHALCLQNLVASTTVDSAIAIHTARILFSCALCWYCYMLYLPWCTASSDSGAFLMLDEASGYLIALPEIRLLREERRILQSSPIVLDKAMSDLRRIQGANPSEMKASTLCVLESTLRRLGTSGISQRFADLIQAFITGGAQ